MANKKKAKKHGVSIWFILYFIGLLGFFVYMVTVNDYIQIVPPFRISESSSEYWNWYIYKLSKADQKFIDITYFIEVFSYAIGLIYLFAVNKEGGFKRHFKNLTNRIVDIIILSSLIIIKVLLFTSVYRLYMVLITPIFWNIFVMRFVSYSKKHDD